jgi:ATP-dependent exoDNAse (exonuclease V) beta subunit
VPAPVIIEPRATALVRRFLPHTPSDQRTGIVSGASLFAPDASDAADIGSAVHAAFAAVTWWRSADADNWQQRMRTLGIPEAAIAIARSCLDAPALASVFVRTTDAAEVWCERGFEFVHEGAWITGRFDRVIIERDSHGRAKCVRVFDFKTDRVTSDPAAWRTAAERFRSQVTWYRRAAARLTGVPETEVICEIVFTGARDAAGRVPGPVVV